MIYWRMASLLELLAVDPSQAVESSIAPFTPAAVSPENVVLSPLSIVMSHSRFTISGFISLTTTRRLCRDVGGRAKIAHLQTLSGCDETVAQPADHQFSGYLNRAPPRPASIPPSTLPRPASRAISGILLRTAASISGERILDKRRRKCGSDRLSG